MILTMRCIRAIPCIENEKLKNILVTGGAGFIGSAFIRYLMQGVWKL